MISGFATAMYRRWTPGGVNSNDSDLPDVQSIVFRGSRGRPRFAFWPGNGRFGPIQ